ncbi:hypothetical protein SLEP1_g24516 [Rubroshorea leprosula]|uniref:Uncharacterized protein n=1 Tax=Rubroshorea leprosula TaxID=152421 RepID=A0AAV5JM78_9ROSI|nr:hypothetical protein SLEP1_g24516 [Rubroshorea leprosula]
MEEDIEECNLEAKLDVEFAVLDPELDVQLKEEISRAVSKIGHGMDKGDDALVNLSQRKVLSLNHRGTFSHERGPIIGKKMMLVCIKFGDYIVGTVSEMSFIELERRGSKTGSCLTKRGGARPTPLESYLLTHMTCRPDAPEDAPPTWICPQAEQTYNDAHQKYVEKHGPNKDSWLEWDPLIWKEVVGPPKKGQMRGMSTLQDPTEHGIPWR